MTGTITQNPHIALEIARAYQRARFEDAVRSRQAKAASASRAPRRRIRSIRVFRSRRAAVATA